MEFYSIAWIHHDVFILLPIDIGCFQFGPITNKADRDICVQMLCEHRLLFLFGEISISGMAAFYDRSMFNLRSCKIVFQVAAPFSPPPAVMSVPVTLAMTWHDFFILANLMAVQGCLITASIYVSLLTNDAEHLFICLLAICTFCDLCSNLCPFFIIEL